MSEYVGSWLGKGATPPKEKGEGRTNNISLPTNRIEFCSVTKFYLSFKRELTFTGGNPLRKYVPRTGSEISRSLKINSFQRLKVVTIK